MMVLRWGDSITYQTIVLQTTALMEGQWLSVEQITIDRPAPSQSILTVNIDILNNQLILIMKSCESHMPLESICVFFFFLVYKPIGIFF